MIYVAFKRSSTGNIASDAGKPPAITAVRKKSQKMAGREVTIEHAITESEIQPGYILVTCQDDDGPFPTYRISVEELYELLDNLYASSGHEPVEVRPVITPC